MHNSYVLREFGILVLLCTMIPLVGSFFLIYRKLSYVQLIYIFGSFYNPLDGSLDTVFNTEMLRVCETVEKGYTEIEIQ